jgi:hypothetical protein
VKEIIESAVSVGAALSLMVLVLAVVHETTFFLIVGYQFQALMSPTDYMFSALGWLPIVIILLVIGYLIPVPFNKRAEEIVSKENPTPEDISTMAEIADRLDRIMSTILWVGFVLLILALSLTDFLRLIWVNFAILMVVFFIVRHGKIIGIEYSRRNLFVLFGFILFGNAIIYGAREGFSSLEKMQQIYAFRFNKDDKEYNWPVIRNLSRGVLIHDVINNRVSFYKWDDIATMSVRVSIPAMGGPPLCYLFDLSYCPKGPTTP